MWAFWEAATAKGALLYEGWGADLGFPGFVPVQDGEGGEEVQGVYCRPKSYLRIGQY
ncbi:hypothetical protein [Microbulbifer agarilyticus]